MDHNSLAEISGEIFCHLSQMILFSWSLLEGFCCFLHSALKYSRDVQLHSSQVMFSLFSSSKTLVWFFFSFFFFPSVLYQENSYSAELLETRSHLFIYYLGLQSCIHSSIYYKCHPPCNFCTHAALLSAMLRIFLMLMFLTAVPGVIFWEQTLLLLVVLLFIFLLTTAVTVSFSILRNLVYLLLICNSLHVDPDHWELEAAVFTTSFIKLLMQLASMVNHWCSHHCFANIFKMAKFTSLFLRTS